MTAGFAAVGVATVIQRDDGHGGYDVSFSTGGLDIYHVHFGSGGCRVKIVRHKAISSSEGNNIIKHMSDQTKRLSDLAHECSTYANHFALLTNLATSVANAPRLANNEIA